MGLSLRRLGYVMLGQAGRQRNSSGAIWKPAFAAFLMMGEGFAMGEISHAKSLSKDCILKIHWTTPQLDFNESDSNDRDRAGIMATCPAPKT
jgi:hypothetical protein